jgi:hypothetical protein
MSRQTATGARADSKRPSDAVRVAVADHEPVAAGDPFAQFGFPPKHRGGAPSTSRTAGFAEFPKVPTHRSGPCASRCRGSTQTAPEAVRPAFDPSTVTADSRIPTTPPCWSPVLRPSTGQPWMPEAITPRRCASRPTGPARASVRCRSHCLFAIGLGFRPLEPRREVRRSGMNCAPRTSGARV